MLKVKRLELHKLNTMSKYLQDLPLNIPKIIHCKLNRSNWCTVLYYVRNCTVNHYNMYKSVKIGGKNELGTKVVV